MPIKGSNVVGSSTVSVEIGLSPNVSNINLIDKVLETEGGGRSSITSHVVDGVKTLASTLKLNITEGIEGSKVRVSEVLETEVKD